MEVGTQVGAYRVLQLIGQGGMGSVWLAEHTMLGRRAAIKLLHPMYTVRPDIVNRFFNEARAATAIADPGIVQIFDFGHHADGTAYIAMEMLDGEPLDRRLRRLVRLDVAKELTFTGRVVSGAEAVSLGLATRVADPPREAALALAAEIAGKSPDAIRHGKRLLEEAWHADAATGLALEAKLQGKLIGSANQVEAVKAALEKRDARFENAKD